MWGEPAAADVQVFLTVLIIQRIGENDLHLFMIFKNFLFHILFLFFFIFYF